MATNNTDFLRFSAYSIKDLITRKLSQDTKYTDQVYEGSNLAILIDIFSYIGQSLLYSLNNAAAESMWSDTQLYENINRLAKFLSYNPKGVITSTAEFNFSNQTDDSKPKYEGQIILPYTMIDTNLFDASGNKVYYSLTDSFYINSALGQSITMLNGKWKQYDTIFVSTGDKYQTFILDGLQSDASNDKYVVNNCVHVYVRHYEPILGHYVMIKYTPVSGGLFTDNLASNGINIYSFSDKIYDLRLNENKTYEITFGNGINGKIPNKDDQIYIFYLEGNGSYGQLKAYDVQSVKIKCSAEDLGIPVQIFNELMADYNGKYDTIYTEDGIKVSNITNSSEAEEEETVDSIRMNAPNAFKIGNRLVTSDDWTYYIKNTFLDNIIDVKCQNNYEYISTFYKWLYDLGVQKHSDVATTSNGGNYYLNQARLIKYGYEYSDAADANNIYLWIQMKNQSSIYANYIEQNIYDIKNMTSKPVYLKPLTTYFAICAAKESDAVTYLNINKPSLYSYLEITLNNNVIYTTSSIKSQVSNIIQKYFTENRLTIGHCVDTNDILDEIYAINGVECVRTIWKKNNVNEEGIIVKNGLSFASWTKDIIDTGDDLEVSTSARKLQDFQFPSLYDPTNLINNIIVISKSINNTNDVQY